MVAVPPLVLFACSSSDVRPAPLGDCTGNCGNSTDATVTVDAGNDVQSTGDGATGDAAPLPDGAQPDGALPDGGFPDGALPDGNPPPDGGGLDAATE